MKTNGTLNCPRPKPCNSSPPDFSIFSKHTTSSSTRATSLVTRLSENRNSALSYYQHPVLRGCHPFSLELARNPHQGSRTSEVNQYKRQQHQQQQQPIEKVTSDNNTTATNSDVDNDNDTDADREIDLSLKTDLNRSRTNSSDEDKMLSSPDQESSVGSNETTATTEQQFKGKLLHSSYIKSTFKNV